MTLYRLSWEMVNVGDMKRFCNADPYFYSNVQQLVPNSEIPEECWHTVSRETDDPWAQYDQLREWADADREFVRNVVLEEQVSEPAWREVDSGDAKGRVLRRPRKIKDAPQA